MTDFVLPEKGVRIVARLVTPNMDLRNYAPGSRIIHIEEIPENRKRDETGDALFVWIAVPYA